MTAGLAIIVLCSVTVVFDVLFRRVPNWLILGGIAVHIGMFLLTGTGWNALDIQQSLLGGVIGLALFVPLYALRAMGAGDVKFFALLGAMMGPSYLIPLWLIGSVLAGVHAMAWYVTNRSAFPALAGWHKWTARIHDAAWFQNMMHKRAGRKGIPYAAYLAVGGLVIVTTG